MLDDPETAQYTHTDCDGSYTCTVANSVSSALAEITLEGKCLTLTSLFSVPLCTGDSTPSDVEAVQYGLTSIILTWTASSDTTGYRISYTSDSDSDSIEVGANCY